MFNLFKKSYKHLSEYPESWSILKEKSRGVIIKINTGLKNAAGHPDYPIKVGVAIPVGNKSSNEIGDFKYAVEDFIHKQLSNNERGVLVAIITAITGEQFVEFLSYTRKDLDFGVFHQELKKAFPIDDVQMYANQENSWNTYRSFLK